VVQIHAVFSETDSGSAGP